MINPETLYKKENQQKNKLTEKKRLNERRFKDLQTKHNKWVQAYQDLSDFINPTRGIFNGDRTTIGKMIDHKKLLSSYATHALRIFASGMNSGMTNKSSEWFKLTLDNPAHLDIPGVRVWLDMVEDTMYSVINNSNLYKVLYSAYEELGQFGTACYIILQDFEDVIRCRSFTAGEYSLGIDNKGRVNAFGREYEMTVDQLVREFGLDSVSPEVKTNYKSKQLDVPIKVCHLIQQNIGRDPSKEDIINMPYTSCYWEKGNNTHGFLATRGFKKFRVIAPRWDVTTTDMEYGYSPGWHAIGAIKELQKTRRDKLLMQEKLHNPPVSQDASVQGHANLLPGGVTKSSANTPKSGVRASYEVKDSLSSILELINEEKEEIDRFFFVNLFLMLLNSDDGKKTATEIAERAQEKVMMMGPALHSLDEEMLTPTLEIIYEDLQDNFRIPPPPDAIAGLEIKIKYTSLLVQAQRAVGIAKIDRVLGIAGVTADLDPSSVDVIDFDEIIRESTDMEGAPAKILKSIEEVQEIREERIKQRNAELALEASKDGAKGTKDLAGAKLDENTALDVVAGR